MPTAHCSNCGRAIIARGPEPPHGRFCMAPDCQRARARATNRLRGKPKPPRPCAWCLGLIPPSHSKRATCSDECDREHRRFRQRLHYYRRVAEDPEYNRRRWAAQRARAEVDPEHAERLRAAMRRGAERRRLRAAADPAYREQLRATARAYYAIHAEELQRRRRERLDAMTPDARERWLEANRRYQREYARKRRAQRAADPVARATYIAYLVEYRRQRALLRLASVGAELLERRDATTDRKPRP